MIRMRLALVPWLIMLALVAAGLLWSAGDRLAGLGHTIATGAADVGGPFTLTDQTGKPHSDTDFRGRYLLVYFGYSFCPDVCPTTLGIVADAFARLGARKNRIVPVFITLDPERDTPAVLKGYLGSFGPEFVGLTGSPGAIKRTAQEFRVYYTKHPLPNGGYAIDHTSVLYLMGPDGKFITYYDDTSVGADTLAADLRKRMGG
jgi:protein SCO1/2